MPSSKVTCRYPRNPFRNSKVVMALVSIVDSMTPRGLPVYALGVSTGAIFAAKWV